MNANTVFISIVIPVYNEEKRVQSFLLSVIDYVQQKNFSYELVIVDDGSSDRTIAVVDSLLTEKLADTYRIVKLPVNRGKGAAIREGMLQAKGDYIFFLDADGSTSIREIDSFIPKFSPGIDLYIATRTIKHKAPQKRKFFGYGYIFMANLLLGLRVVDITCGFKCYTRASARKIFPLQTLNNWSFDAEDIFIARKHGYEIMGIPVHWQHVGGSKVKVFKNVLICGLDLLRIRYKNYRGLYQQQSH
jgi:dolichyl-phosphate beta-glucosyltransferase